MSKPEIIGTFVDTFSIHPLRLLLACRLTNQAENLPSVDDYIDTEVIKNEDGSTSIRWKNKDTGEVTGEMHVVPRPDGNGVTAKIKDKHGAEQEMELAWKQNPDGSFTASGSTTRPDGTSSSGEVTLRQDSGGTSVTITVTDTNGKTDSGTVDILASNGAVVEAGPPEIVTVPDTNPAPPSAPAPAEPAEGTPRDPGDRRGSSGNGGMGGVKAL